MIERFVKTIDRIIEQIIVFLMAFAVISTVLQVTYRYVISRLITFPLSWTEELTRYMMVWVTFLMIGMGLAKGVHASIDLIIFLPYRYRKYFEILTNIAMLIYGWILLYYGWYLTMFNAGQLSPAMRISMAVVYVSIPIGGVILLLRVLVRIIEGLKSWFNEKE